MECCLHKSACRVRLYSGASCVSSRHLPLHENDRPLAALGQRADVVAPHTQRGAHLVRVRTSIVDADNSGAVTGLMIENLLDDVWRGAQIAEARCKRSAKVMQRPWHDAIAEPSIECSLGACPAC